MKKLNNQEETKMRPRCNYRIVGDTTRFSRIIKAFWEDIDKVYNVESDRYNCSDDIDDMMIKTVRALKIIDRWKSNLFIIYVHFGKSQDKTAKALKTTPNAIGRAISVIRKEIKEIICRL